MILLTTKKSSKKKKMTYSQKKRSQLDYRREYFKHNPGLFGCIWTCAYCKRPLLGKSAVVVDHIVALNNVLGQNANYNLVAACQKCNSTKSDTVNLSYITRGFFSKAFDSILFAIQRFIIFIFVGIWYCLWYLLKAMVAPLRSPLISIRVIAFGVYGVLAYVLISNLAG